jgi:hypothetical protein
VDVQKVLENETRDDRLKRLLDLLNVYTGGTTAAPVPLKATRTLEKIEKVRDLFRAAVRIALMLTRVFAAVCQMELTMGELKASGAGKTVSKLCKHSDGTIAQAAKKLKDHWTQMVSILVVIAGYTRRAR